MGLLGDKMLQAGVVSKADADRVHRQEVIEKENKRKEEERRERAEERWWRKDRNGHIKFLATHVIDIQLKDLGLEYLGFSKEERQSILRNDPPPTPALLLKLGSMTDQILVVMEAIRRVGPKERDRLMQDPQFLKVIKPWL